MRAEPRPASIQYRFLWFTDNWLTGWGWHFAMASQNDRAKKMLLHSSETIANTSNASTPCTRITRGREIRQDRFCRR